MFTINFIIYLIFFQQNDQPPGKQYLFLMNYIDKDNQNIEIIALLLVYKILYLEHFYDLWGKSSEINTEEGFKSEGIKRYSHRLFNRLKDVFSYMPIDALNVSKIVAVNSGISPNNWFNWVFSILFKWQFQKSQNRYQPKIFFWSVLDPCMNEYPPHPNSHSFVFGLT